MMTIAFDAQPLLDEKLTGIGYNQVFSVKKLVKNHSENKYIFKFFSMRKNREKMSQLQPYIKNNGFLDNCRIFSNMLYRMITLVIPLPYGMFFSKKADIYHFFNYYLPPFVPGKRVLTIHDLVFRTYPETMSYKTRIALKLCFKKSVKRADLIITVSDFTKKQLLHFYPEFANKRIETIFNCVDTDLYKKAEPSVIKDVLSRYKINDDYILFLGTLEPRKNLERLLEAYADVKKKNTNCPMLVIAGKRGWLFESIFETVKRFDLADSVIFTGYIPCSDKPALLSGARAFCFPSLFEGFGMPVLEAMACETPVLTSNAASLPEVCGDAAVYVDPFSVSDIEQGLTKICFDDNLRKELVKKGRERVNFFCWDREIEKLNNLYRELVGKW